MRWGDRSILVRHARVLLRPTFMREGHLMAHRHPSYKAACSKPNCESDYFPDKWGKIEAVNLGWFLQRNGDAWCPKHIPDWVAEWRARKKAKEEKS